MHRKRGIHRPYYGRAASKSLAKRMESRSKEMKTYIRRIVLVASLVIAGSIPAFAAEQKAVFAGGCFWGVEAVFEHVKGVIDVKSGYAGGNKETANYDEVSTGETKHAES